MKALVTITIIFFSNLVHAQNINSNQKEKTPEQLSEVIFDHIEFNKDDVTSWVFDIVDTDSLKLVKLSNAVTFLGLTPNGPVRFEKDASLQYPDAFVLETADIANYNQEGLAARITSLRKSLKKLNVILGRVGYSKKKETNAKVSGQLIKKEKPIGDNLLLSGIIKHGGSPLPYSTIGIRKTTLGTISDAEGKFKLNIPKALFNEILTVSYVGYEDKNISILDIDNATELIVELNENITELKEVVVSAKPLKKTKRLVLGQEKAGNKFGWVQGTGAGAEAARLMKLLNKKILLKTVSIYVDNPKEEKFTLLVNIYEQDTVTKLPGRQLLKKIMIVNSTVKQGWLDVDLNYQNLVLDKPFFVSFQWPNQDIKIPFVGIGGSKAYTRASAFGPWKNSGDFDWVIKAEGIVLD
jgi:hypothetical protein